MLRQMLGGKKYTARLFSRDASGVNIFHSPWWLPRIGRAPLKDPSIRLYLFALSRLAKFRRNKPVVWLSRPDMIDYVEHLSAKTIIYHVVDEYSGYGNPSDSQRKKLLAQEAKLLQSADLAIVVTPSLHALKSKHNSKTYLVQNAADFSAYALGNSPMPDDMCNIRRPIIGYTGLIAARLDLDMIIAASTARPDWSFAFIGAVNDDQCKSSMNELRSLKNVYFLGQKSISETPAYVNHFDVCTIPYAVNLRAQHASPLKLYEYAAASKPIVTTDFAAAREFGGHLEIVRNATEFIDACARCIHIDSLSESIVANRNFASENTWDNRVQQVSDIIRTNLK